MFSPPQAAPSRLTAALISAGSREVADVGDDRDAVRARLFGDRLELRAIDVDQEEVGTLARERERNRAADAGRRARHQRLPAANGAHRPLLLSPP